jgi:UDP-glucose 4-epimerase
MTRTLITGGAGFIGSHLCELLLDKGQEVYIIDDLSTGSIYNIQHLKDNPRFHYTIDTMMNEPVLAELVDTCEVVYHLAAAVGVRLIVESPIRTIETNIKGTELVLKWANKKKKKVMLASTSEVYGKNASPPFKEDDDLLLGPSSKGRWSYACSKLLDEFLGLAYHRERGLPVYIARLFNTVGPRQTGRYGMVIPRFVRQALSGQPLTVYDDGQMVRAFVYVGDVVNGLYQLMEHPGSEGQVFNIGNPSPVTIEYLARRVIELSGSNSVIEYVPYTSAYTEGFEDIRERIPDISKVSNLIDFKPQVELDEIILKVIEYERAVNQVI